jgi:hypothetical protein
VHGTPNSELPADSSYPVFLPDNVIPPCATELSSLLACFATSADLRTTGECSKAAKDLHACMANRPKGGKPPKSSVSPVSRLRTPFPRGWRMLTASLGSTDQLPAQQGQIDNTSVDRAPKSKHAVRTFLHRTTQDRQHPKASPGGRNRPESSRHQHYQIIHHSADSAEIHHFTSQVFLLYQDLSQHHSTYMYHTRIHLLHGRKGALEARHTFAESESRRDASGAGDET